MKLENIKIYKMGPKLGIGFSEPYFAKGDLIEITLKKEDKRKSFFTKFNRIITLRKNITKFLGLEVADKLNLEIKKIDNLKRADELFKDNKIDMLTLIPEKTSRSYEIFVSEFRKKEEEWLRIWYAHERGSGRQIEIKRYVEIEAIGNLLGQYQAEGTKHKGSHRKFAMEFRNKLVEEHEEFVDSLLRLGVPEKMLEFRFVFNPNKLSEEQVKEHIYHFRSVINHPVKRSPNKGSKGIGFGTVIRNVLLTEIILYSMDKIRRLLAETNNYTFNQQKLANCFFAKLLTGDGTLDSRCSRRAFPELSIKIVDKDKDNLEDYSKIMRRLSFNSRINGKHIHVISSCSFKNLLYLHQIKAFKNTGNWNKLLVSVKLCLEEGRRINTYYRFLELAKYDTFSGSIISERFGIGLWTAKDWLYNKHKEYLVTKIRHNVWTLTDEGKNLANTLSFWEEDYDKLVKERKIEDPARLLASLKRKN